MPRNLGGVPSLSFEELEASNFCTSQSNTPHFHFLYWAQGNAKSIQEISNIHQFCHGNKLISINPTKASVKNWLSWAPWLTQKVFNPVMKITQLAEPKSLLGMITGMLSASLSSSSRTYFAHQSSSSQTFSYSHYKSLLLNSLSLKQ